MIAVVTAIVMVLLRVLWSAAGAAALSVTVAGDQIILNVPWGERAMDRRSVSIVRVHVPILGFLCPARTRLYFTIVSRETGYKALVRERDVHGETSSACLSRWALAEAGESEESK